MLHKYLAEYDLAAHFSARAVRKQVLFERRLERIGAPTPGGRLWDVASGDGQFLALAREHGWEVSGVELNPAAADRARTRGLPVEEGLFEEMEELPWGEVDVVTSWDTLEHTPRPRAFADKLARLLRPGGRLHLTTLNRHALVGRCFGMQWSMVVEDHFTYWSRRSLVALAERAGLQVTQVHSFGLGRDFFRWLDRRSKPVQATGSSGVASADWSSRRPVLMAETMANHALDLTGLGVGIAIEARRVA